MKVHRDVITSMANSRVKEIARLHKSVRERKKKRCFVVEGARMVQEAFAYGKLERVYFSEGFYRSADSEWQSVSSEVPCEIISDSIFCRVCDTVTPQGVLGTARMPEYTLQDLLGDQRHFYILLDAVRDPGNLGTIVRTAEGAGMSGVIMGGGTVDIFNSKVVRATMGAVFRVPFYYEEDLCSLIEHFKSLNIPVYGTMMQGSVLYDTPDYVQGAGVVIGSEADGISADVAEVLTGAVRVPMEGKLESLNASVTAAVLMYEMARQRRTVLTP